MRLRRLLGCALALLCVSLAVLHARDTLDARNKYGAEWAERRVQNASLLLPDFIVIGAQKAGTTALKDVLRRHPRICMPAAELKFFDLNYRFGLTAYGSMLERQLGRSRPDHRASSRPRARIAAELPGARLVAVLRDPVRRAPGHAALFSYRFIVTIASCVHTPAPETQIDGFR